MRILLVDNDNVSLRLCSSLLAVERYDVVVATTAREAINYLDKGSIDLVISDIMMPGRGGFQFLKYLKSTPRLSRIPVITCSNQRDTKAVSRSIELGAKDYIAKPFSRDVLLTKVKRVLKDNAAVVLIVDDEPFIRSLLCRTVEREGLKTIMASSGMEALDLLAANKVRMVISDIAMPGMSGLELLNRIKEKYPAMPVLFITGQTERFTKECALAAGADNYITKPFKNVEIAQRLAFYL